MKKFALVIAAMCFAGSAFAGAPENKGTEKAAEVKATPAPAAAAKPVKGEGVYFHSEDLKWESPMGPQGPSFAFVVGDMKTKGKPASLFMKFPAGFDSSWHTHDSDYSGVVVKGIVTHQVQGGEEKKLTAGSYWTNNAKVNHTNKCLAEGGECIIFGTNPKGFSFTPKTADGKDVPAPPKDAAKATGGSH